jgi:hypothetical protein
MIADILDFAAVLIGRVLAGAVFAAWGIMVLLILLVMAYHAINGVESLFKLL